MDAPEERDAFLDQIARIANSSPYYRHVRMQVVGFTPNGCIMTMDAGRDHSNLYGNTHGGAIASIADSTCGISLVPALHEDEYAMTQHLDVSYLRPAGIGLLRAEGRLISRGRNSAVLEADVFDGQGELVAHAHSIHSIRRRPGGFHAKGRPEGKP